MTLGPTGGGNLSVQARNYGSGPRTMQNINRTLRSARISAPVTAWCGKVNTTCRRRLALEDLWGLGDQTACKPGSVPPALSRGRDGHSSGPPVAGRFSRPTRAPGPAKARRSRDRRDAPIRSCSRRGLPCRPGHPVRGGLLPHPFTLAAPGPKPGRAVCFLWRYPWGRPRRALPAAYSPWSPDFPLLRPRDERATARPSDP